MWSWEKERGCGKRGEGGKKVVGREGRRKDMIMGTGEEYGCGKKKRERWHCGKWGRGRDKDVGKGGKDVGKGGKGVGKGEREGYGYGKWGEEE